MKKILYLFLISFVLFSCVTRKNKQVNLYNLDEISKSLKINLKVNDVVKLTATTNPSTGYNWTIFSDGPCSIKLINRTKEDIYTDNRVGVPLREVFEFKAINEGNCTMSFDYSRGWEKNVSEVKQIHFKVK